MPIKRAAYKAIRADKKKHLRNISTKTTIKTLTKKVETNLKSKKKTDLEQSLKNLISALDKAAQKGIIHKKTASRTKSRMSKRVWQAIKK